ncbi:uncharacterized protein LOC142554736 [Primulina tabacum]|uniref:uncharacterized protein LOC142554736 n=1 Tax=Primulina tabacum TaxID=48773 RepID=UPI003F59A461
MEEAQKHKREVVRMEKEDRVAKSEERGPRRDKQGHFSHHVPLKIIWEREVQECSRDLALDHQHIWPDSINVIFKDALVQMDLQGFQLETVETALFGFAGHVVYPEGEIVLPLTLGSRDLKKTMMTTFTVVDSPSSYNIMLGRSAMNELRAVASTYHQKIKFVGSRVGEVRGDQLFSRKCNMEAVRVDQGKARKEEKKARLDEGGGRMVENGEMHFVAEEEHEIVEIGPGQQIQQELTGISPLVAENHLNIIPGSHPVKQKKMHFGPEKDRGNTISYLALKCGAGAKVHGEVENVRRLSGPNKAFPKDHYPLPGLTIWWTPPQALRN